MRHESIMIYRKLLRFAPIVASQADIGLDVINMEFLMVGSRHFRPPRQGRNPKTGEAVALSGKHVPHFKPGKDLRERVNDGADRPIRD